MGEVLGVVTKRLERLKRGLRGRADVRSTSAKWAWVEYVLAQGGPDEGLAVLEAVRNGGNFAAYKQAFSKLDARVGSDKPRRSLAIAQV